MQLLPGLPNLKEKSMSRPKHFQEYENMTEIVPGVFVNPGESVHIVDEIDEVACWNNDEWQDDPESITATVNAVILATKYGAKAVRENIEYHGKIMDVLVAQTFQENYPEET